MINFLRQIGGLRSCTIADLTVYGGKMRLYPGINRSDKVMLAMAHIFDWRERKALAEHLQRIKNPSFIDIGANIGAYSVFVHGLGVHAKIIAIEADPEIFQRLNFNLAQDVIKLNIALASSEGMIPFYINEASRGESGLVASAGKRKIEVPAKRLLQVLDENNIIQPSALKIDVEGGEMEILQKFYEEASPNRWPEMVIMEYYYDSAAMNLLLAKGYAEVLRTKMNIVLKLADI